MWYKDGEPLIGEISSECVLEEVGEGDKGKYFCLVFHPNGDSSRQSHTAEVTLKSGNGEVEYIRLQIQPHQAGVVGQIAINLLILSVCWLLNYIRVIYSF